MDYLLTQTIMNGLGYQNLQGTNQGYCVGKNSSTHGTQLAIEEGIQYKLWKGFSITFEEGVSRIEPYREAVVSIFCACFSYTGI